VTCYVGVTRMGSSTWSSCVGRVMENTLDDCMRLAFLFVPSLTMLLWWDDSCCLSGIFLGDLTL
jgi:hypothetical protein